jgi:SAM-dependent methyltransferase
VFDAIEKTVARFADELPAGQLVLDVGCGLRPYEPFFARQQYVGIDVPDSGREASGKLADEWFDGVHVPFEDGSCGAVICTEVLEHCLQPDELLREIHRVLVADGKLLVTVPFIWGEHETPYDFRRFSTYGIRDAVVGAGFEVVEQSRLSPGVDAIAMLVASEVNADRVRAGGGRRIVPWLAGYLWALQLRVWRRLYTFDRIYIDNAVIAVKPSDQAHESPATV